MYVEYGTACARWRRAQERRAHFTPATLVEAAADSDDGHGGHDSGSGDRGGGGGSRGDGSRGRAAPGPHRWCERRPRRPRRRPAGRFDASLAVGSSAVDAPLAAASSAVDPRGGSLPFPCGGPCECLLYNLLALSSRTARPLAAEPLMPRAVASWWPRPNRSVDSHGWFCLTRGRSLESFERGDLCVRLDVHAAHRSRAHGHSHSHIG